MLLLALVLVISFVPLYFAVSTYTTTAHAVVRRQQALELADSVAAAFTHAATPRAPELSSLLRGRVIALHHVAAETRFVSAVHLATLPELVPLTDAGASAVAWLTLADADGREPYMSRMEPGVVRSTVNRATRPSLATTRWR